MAEGLAGQAREDDEEEVMWRVLILCNWDEPFAVLTTRDEKHARGKFAGLARTLEPSLGVRLTGPDGKLVDEVLPEDDRP